MHLTSKVALHALTELDQNCKKDSLGIANDSLKIIDATIYGERCYK